jgi:hypothetical protein
MKCKHCGKEIIQSGENGWVHDMSRFQECEMTIATPVLRKCCSKAPEPDGYEESPVMQPADEILAPDEETCDVCGSALIHWFCYKCASSKPTPEPEEGQPDLNPRRLGKKATCTECGCDYLDRPEDTAEGLCFQCTALTHEEPQDWKDYPIMPQEGLENICFEFEVHGHKVPFSWQELVSKRDRFLGFIFEDIEEPNDLPWGYEVSSGKIKYAIAVRMRGV